MNAAWHNRKARANAARRAAYFLKNQPAIRERALRREEALRQEEAHNKVLAKGRVPQYPDGPRKAARRLIDAAKNWPCTDCGNQFHSWAMEFDHRDPSTKVGDMGKLQKHSPDAVRREIAKCDLVCANCHRVRTARRRLGLPATLPPPDYAI